MEKNGGEERERERERERGGGGGGGGGTPGDRYAGRQIDRLTDLLPG